MKQPTLSSLRAFRAVAEAASFTVAATRVFRTQPSLSRQIAQLERELGLVLFERCGRTLALTSAGEALYRQAVRIADDVAAFQRSARQFSQGVRSALRVGANPLLYDRTIPSLLTAYQRRWGDVSVMLTAAGAPVLEEQIESRRLDIAFTRFVANDAIAAQRLFPMHLVAIMGVRHRLARRKRLEIVDIQDEPLLLMPPEVGSRSLLEQTCRDSGIPLRNIRLECGAYNGLVSLATSGQGVAVVLSMVDLVDPKARVIPIEHCGRPLGMWAAAIWNRNGSLEPQGQAFLALAARRLSRNFPGSRYALPPLPDPDH